MMNIVIFVLSLPLGLLITLLLPVLAVLYLFGSSTLRIGVRLFMEAFHGCQRLSDAVVVTTTSGTTRATRVALGLGFLAARTTLRPVHVRFERVERWVEARLDAAPETAQPVAGVPSPQVLLGLRDGFSKEDFQDRYRAIINVLHPDKQGSDWLAQHVNNAKDAICKARGWK